MEREFIKLSSRSLGHWNMSCALPPRDLGGTAGGASHHTSVQGPQQSKLGPQVLGVFTHVFDNLWVSNPVIQGWGMATWADRCVGGWVGEKVGGWVNGLLDQAEELNGGNVGKVRT